MISLNQCLTHTKLTCGVTADIKVGSKISYAVLKYKNENRKILYNKLNDESYDYIPKWLYPIKTSKEFAKLEEGDGRNQALFDYILTLQANNFTKDEAREIIRIINKYILKEALSDKELNTILRDDAFNKPSFFNGNSFLFDKFANFIMNNNHIIKIYNQLHLYQDGVYISNFEDMFKQLFNEKLNKDWEMKREIEKVVRDRLDELFKKKTKEMTEKIQDIVLVEMLKEDK